MKKQNLLLAIIRCLIFCRPYAYANTWVQQQMLMALDGAAGDYFGFSVSISDDYAIVGAYSDDNNGTDSGSVYIFKRDGNLWSQQQKLIAPDGAAGDYFGLPVSISDDYAIVGAHGDDDNGSNSGSVYIFKRDSNLWSQQQKLIAPDGTADDYFGISVSISDDYAIVGAHGDDNNGSNSGSVYIFKRDGNLWSQQQMLTASDGAAGNYFGYSVSISDDYVMVGAYGDDNNGADSGSVYIFKRDGNLWSQQQMLTASDGAANDYFGISVSISDDYAIVGAHGDDNNGSNSGSVYIFKRDGNLWSQQQMLTASDGAANDFFGRTVVIGTDYAIVGAYGDDNNGTDSGSVYIFKRDGNFWSQQQMLTALGGVAGDYFGWSVSIGTDYAIVGAYGDDNIGVDSGSAYVFEFCPRADLNDDCKVDLADFLVMANWWLYGVE